MKRYRFTIVLIAVILVTACDVLDVKPYHSIPSDQSIKTKKDLQSAITGCYDAFQAVGYYGRDYLVVGDLAADNLTWSGTTAGYNQISNNSILADNTVVSGIWADIYRALSRINIALAQVPGLTMLSDAELRDYMAELSFLRALAHFDLVRLFGPVPVRTEPVKGADEELNVSRQPVNVVYEQVFKDLDYALANIGNRNERGRVTKAAILALTARVNLFYYTVTQNAENLHKAISAAENVIDDFSFALEDDFAKLYNGNLNRESIFEIVFSPQDRNRLAEYFFPTSLSGRREFAPTNKLLSLYGTIDLRREVSIGLSGENLYAKKYNRIETGEDNVYIFRLAEMYLISAEAKILLGTDLVTARDYINLIRQRAGLPIVLTSGAILLARQIREQRHLEFAFEGHRWFDLIRTGRTSEEVATVTSINQTLFPIPLNEILANKNAGMVQNPGY